MAKKSIPAAKDTTAPVVEAREFLASLPPYKGKESGSSKSNNDSAWNRSAKAGPVAHAIYSAVSTHGGAKGSGGLQGLLADLAAFGPEASTAVEAFEEASAAVERGVARLLELQQAGFVPAKSARGGRTPSFTVGAIVKASAKGKEAGLPDTTFKVESVHGSSVKVAGNPFPIARNWLVLA